MKELIQLALCLVISSVAFAADVDIQLVVPNKLNDWEQAQYNQFIQNVTKSLPSKIKLQLKSENIELAFVNSKDSIIDLSSLDETCSYYAFESGRTILKNLFRKNHRIEINTLLFSEILKGPTQSKTYNCGHKTAYRLAMATLIHELGHIYDDKANLSNERRFLHLTSFSGSFE